MLTLMSMVLPASMEPAAGAVGVALAIGTGVLLYARAGIATPVTQAAAASAHATHRATRRRAIVIVIVLLQFSGALTPSIR